MAVISWYYYKKVRNSMTATAVPVTDSNVLQGEVDKARAYAIGGIVVGVIVTLIAIGLIVWFTLNALQNSENMN